MPSAPQSITVCLEDAIDASRGDMLAHPGNLPWMVQELEAILIWMDNRALRPGPSYLVKHTTNVVRGSASRAGSIASIRTRCIVRRPQHSS